MKRTIDGLILLLFLLHFLFLPIRLGKEHFFIAKHAMQIDNTPVVASATPKNLSSFELSGYLGYIDSDFTLQSRIFVEDRVSHANDSYVLYSASTANNDYYHYDGQKINSVINAGAPMFFGNNLYFVDAPIGHVDRYDDDGILMWSYDVGAFISAFDANEDLVVIGDIVGNLTILSSQGKLLEKYNITGSEYLGIYGVKVSPSSQYIATIAGINQQRFILFKKGVNGYTRFIHEKMDEMRRSVAIFFDNEEKFVYYEGKNKLFIFQISDNVKESGLREFLLHDEELVLFVPDLMDRFFAVVSKKGIQQRLRIYSKDGKYVFGDITFDYPDDMLVIGESGKFFMGLEKVLMEVLWG